jgi:hypothetical protein
LLHCCGEFARKEDMLVEINAGLGMGVWNGKVSIFDAVSRFLVMPSSTAL